MGVIVRIVLWKRVPILIAVSPSLLVAAGKSPCSDANDSAAVLLWVFGFERCTVRFGTISHRRNQPAHGADENAPVELKAVLGGWCSLDSTSKTACAHKPNPR